MDLVLKLLKYFNLPDFEIMESLTNKIFFFIIFNIHL